MPSGRGAALQYRRLTSIAAEQPAEIRARRGAAEEAYGAIRARLGAAGTYDLPGSTPGAGPGGPMPTEATPGILTSRDPAALLDKRGKPITDATPLKYALAQSKATDVVDKEALLAQLEGSTEFRIASRLTAESEQLIAREGPLWDEMIRNTQLPILEGFGAQARANAEAIRSAIQKGGSARREGFEAMVRMQEQAKLNSERVSMIANARVALDKWARTNATDQLKFNEGWAANVAGVRETYNNAMDKASELFLQGALPQMMAATEMSIQYRNQAHAKQRAKVGRWINGALSVASLVAAPFTGGATLPLAAGFAGRALGDLGTPSGVGETISALYDRYGTPTTSPSTYPGGANYPAKP